MNEDEKIKELQKKLDILKKQEQIENLEATLEQKLYERTPEAIKQKEIDSKERWEVLFVALAFISFVGIVAFFAAMS